MYSSNSHATRQIIASALLCGIGIVIPMFSPIRIVLEPASYTLGSHVAIFVAMLISPLVAVAVALGTTLGFFLGGFPIVVVLRAASHVIFALVGALILSHRPDVVGHSLLRTGIFSFGIAIIHAVAEVSVVAAFYFSGGVSAAHYAQGFITSVLLLVGFGTIVHSMLDLGIALIVWRAVTRSGGARSLRPAVSFSRR